MPNLGLSGEPIPLWWTSDFINSSPTGTPEKDEKWIVGEFNCSCVGISKCLPAYCKEDTPEACYNDIPKKDLAEAKRMGDLMGRKGLAILSKVVPELGYWNIRGLAAPCRMMLAYAGMEVKETRYSSKDEWFEKDKPKLLPLNALTNLPYMVEGDKVITQTNALMLYIARKTRLAGKGKQQTDVETALCEVYDLRDTFVGIMYWYKKIVRTVAEFEEEKKTYFENKAGPLLDKFEKLLSKGTPYLTGTSPSAADFHLWEMLDQHALFAKDIGKDACEGRPMLKAFHERFRALDRLQSYFESDAYTLPCNMPGISFWSGPGAKPPADAPTK